MERVLDEQFGPEKPMVQRKEVTCGQLGPFGLMPSKVDGRGVVRQSLKGCERPSKEPAR